MPRRIGPYQLIETLGEGGMGIVYLAEQQGPLHRSVALKVIKLGMNTREVIGRFESERQAVALMDHPNIASVFAAGATEDGRPYFAMEYVPGLPITKYCDHHQLSTRARLDLFTKVCAAVQHAHQKGIIHRDLKPTNVLVMEQDGRPVPKVIDFGVARAIDHSLNERSWFTSHGVLIGTPEYMSPEQSSLGQDPLDTRTDIYSLGVLFYELLVGALPFDRAMLRQAGHDELRRVIRDVEPERPSTRVESLGAAAADIAHRRDTDATALRRELRGDLDWITLKALEKEPGRRYASASEFAADVQRHLADEPVEAGPPGQAYRLKKLARKHKGLLSGVAAVVLTLVLGVTASTCLFIRAEAARTEAERQRREAQRLAYAATIGLASASLDSFDSLEAMRRLSSTEPSLRGWEWQHLVSRAQPLGLVTLSHDSVRAAAVTGSSSFGFSIDGARVFWNTEQVIHVLDARSYERIDQYAREESILAIAPDGSLAVVKSLQPEKDFRLTIVAPHSTKPVATFAGHIGPATHAAFTRNGVYLATAAGEGIRVWNAHSGELVASMSMPHAKYMIFSDDGTQLATAHQTAVRVWATGSGELIHTLTGHTADVLALAFSSDGRRIASAGEDTTIRIWDGRSGRLVVVASGHTDPVTAIAFSPDGTKVLSGGQDSSLRLWDAGLGIPLATWAGRYAAIVSVAFDPAGERVFSAARNGQVRVWSTTQVLRAFDAGESASGPIAMSPDGRSIVAGSEGGMLRLIDADTGRTRAVLRGHTDEVTSLTYDPTGTRIASGSMDSMVTIWDSALARTLVIPAHDAAITTLAFSPTGHELASGSVDKTIRVWDVQSGRRLAEFGLNDQVNAVAFSTDGSVVIVGSGSPARFVPGRVTLRLWNWRAGHIVSGVDGRDGGAVTALGVSPDGRRIAVAGFGASDVKVWSARLDRLFGTLSGHARPVHAVAFSPDGSRLVTACSDETVRLWDAETYEALLKLRYPRAFGFAGLSISSQGGQIAALAQNYIYLWGPGSKQ